MESVDPFKHKTNPLPTNIFTMLLGIRIARMQSRIRLVARIKSKTLLKIQLVIWRYSVQTFICIQKQNFDIHLSHK